MASLGNPEVTWS